MLRALLEVTLKMVPLKAQVLQPLSGQTRSHSMPELRTFGKDLESWRVRATIPMCQKWHYADICIHSSFCSTDYPQKLKISSQQKFQLQRRGGSEQRNKRPQIGRKNDKRPQIGKMPIARRSRTAEI